MTIRKATPDDLPALLRIYNDEVLRGTATFDTEPRSEEQGKLWLDAHGSPNRPLYVAAIEGQAVGYVSLSTYNPKAAYDGTVELSLYIDRQHRRQGIAAELLTFILDYAAAREDIHAVVSLITAENTASIRLHEKFGFRHAGTLNEVGYKFGRLLDVAYYEKLV